MLNFFQQASSIFCLSVSIGLFLGIILQLCEYSSDKIRKIKEKLLGK